MKPTPTVDAIRKSPAYLQEYAAIQARNLAVIAKNCVYEGCVQSEKCLEANHCLEFNAVTKEKRMPLRSSTSEQPEWEMSGPDAIMAMAITALGLIAVALATGAIDAGLTITDVVEAVATALRQVTQ